MEKEELTPQQVRQRGLYFLLYNAARPFVESQMDKKFPYYTPLAEHPFGLPFPAKPDPRVSTLEQYDEIRYLGVPGCTDISVERMATMLAYVLSFGGYLSSGVVYLRVIYAQAWADHPNQHDLYYEVGTNYHVVMCGGCTDCSGTGGWGKDEMDAVFSLLSEVYGVEIQKVRIEHPRYNKCVRMLDQKICDYKNGLEIS